MSLFCSDCSHCRDTRNVLLCVSTPPVSSLKKYTRSEYWIFSRHFIFFLQILQDLAPKPPIPKIVHIDDPVLAVSPVKSLQERNVHPPESRLVVQHKEYSKQFSSTNLEPPQPPEADCEDRLNHVQPLRILSEIDITGVNFVDPVRNLHQQFSENNLITFGIDINFTRPCKSLID